MSCAGAPGICSTAGPSCQPSLTSAMVTESTKPVATRERSEDAVTQSNSLSEPFAHAAAGATTDDEQLAA
jgi:hypothetical protein